MPDIGIGSLNRESQYTNELHAAGAVFRRQIRNRTRLFIDIVGYSKLLITEQSEQIQKLREIVNPVRWRAGWKRPAHSTLLWLDPDFRSASE
jgi:hypothetical protein